MFIAYISVSLEWWIPCKKLLEADLVLRTAQAVAAQIRLLCVPECHNARESVIRLPRQPHQAQEQWPKIIAHMPVATSNTSSDMERMYERA